MTDFPILSIIMSLPLFSVLAISFTKEESHTQNIKWTGLWTMSMTLAAALGLWSMADPKQSGFQCVERHPWISAYGLEYYVGIDSVSLFWILLSASLFPLIILACWNKIETNIKLYMICLLLLEALVIGAFSSLNFVLFCFFFESILIPLFMIIGIWGGPSKIRAAFKFFLYIFLGSLLMLLLILISSAICFPGTCEFTQELLILARAFTPNGFAAIGILISFIIAGIYGLWFHKGLMLKAINSEKQ